MSNDDLVATLLDAAEIEGAGTMGNLLRMAADRLLKEQEPVKPRCEDYSGNRSARCGYCNAYIVGCYNYCPGCGRAVKWYE